MIKFIYTNIEGFGSIQGPLKYPLNKSGLNILAGPNGAGKTTVFSAFVWCLYGKTLKPKSDVESWPSTRGDDYLGTRVTNFFKVDGKKIKIIRHYEYKGQTLGSRGKNRLILFVDGVESTLRDKPDIQKEIINLLGLSFSLFTNSVVFGQKLKRIISESGTKQKEVFEEAFEVTYITAAKKTSESLKRSYQELHDKAKLSYDHLKSNIGTTKDFIKRNKENIKVFETGKKFKLEKQKQVADDMHLQMDKISQELIDTEVTNTDLKEIEEKIKPLQEKKVLAVTLENDIFRSELQRDQLDGMVTDLERQNKPLKIRIAQPIKKCPTCYQDINKDIELQEKERIKKEASDIIATINTNKTKIAEINLSITNKKLELSSLTQVTLQIDNYTKEKKVLEIKLKDRDLKESEISKYKSLWKVAIDQIREIKEETCTIDNKPYEEKLAGLRKEIKPIKVELKTYRKRIRLHEWAIKDPLSNSGIKAFIFEQMLKKVNKALFEYSKQLGWRINFFIDMESKRKDFNAIIYKGDEVIPYEDLSGGEQQLVDVSIAFSIHDVTTDNRIPFLIMDEVFENLDEDNIEIVGDLIKYKSRNKTIHLITHDANLDVSYGRVIQFKNVKGNTQLA